MAFSAVCLVGFLRVAFSGGSWCRRCGVCCSPHPGLLYSTGGVFCSQHRHPTLRTVFKSGGRWVVQHRKCGGVRWGGLGGSREGKGSCCRFPACAPAWAPQAKVHFPKEITLLVAHGWYCVRMCDCMALSRPPWLPSFPPPSLLRRLLLWRRSIMAYPIPCGARLAGLGCH